MGTSAVRPPNCFRAGKWGYWLLAIGGAKVVLAGVHHLDELLVRGRVFDPKRRRVGKAKAKYRAHHVAAVRYLRHFALALPGTCDIATGFGLTADGWWLATSWNLSGRRIIGADAGVTAYYGFALSPEESYHFAVNAIMPTLPSFTAADVARMHDADRWSAASRAG